MFSKLVFFFLSQQQEQQQKMSLVDINELLIGIITFTLGIIIMYGVYGVYGGKKKKKKNNNNNKPIRVYVDGCWDVMHSGHYNAIRQAKQLGDILVVGVHSDEEIIRNKRKPVMNNKQRMAAVTACKWADEVIFDVPYSPSLQLLKKLNCDYVAHGDDIPIAANGHSAYDSVKSKLKIFRRTPGVSTTHLIARLIEAVRSDQAVRSDGNYDNDKIMHIESTTSWSSFLASSSRISSFSNNRIPLKNDIVVYIDGVFDLFHIGHISALKKAKELGTFLYVGLYDDETIRYRKGKYYPLMNLQERVLNVLSCKYVDDCLIGAPWKITKQVLKSLNISYVVMTPNTKFAENEFNRYDIPKQLGIYKEINTDSNYTTNDLINNIVKQQHLLKNQNTNRIKKAKQYVINHQYIQET